MLSTWSAVLSPGRPRKDWTAAVDKIDNDFKSALPDDALWWGSEAKTQLKLLKADLAEIMKKIRAHDVSKGLCCMV